jgi:nucleoside-diphosphate kinase
MEKTLSIVKPDGVKKGVIGDVIGRFEKAGLKVVALKMVHLSTDGAGNFYAVHKERPFFQSLTEFIASGPIVPMVIEGDNAIKNVRDIMGATNPQDAAEGTIRKDFADSIDSNIVHGSDSPESAGSEIDYFFQENEIFSHQPS